MPQENPFVFGEIIDDANFVNRTDELSRLVRDLADGQKLFLFSPRRFGKSSLVSVALMGWLAPQWISNGNRGETEVATLDGADASDGEMRTVQFWNFNLDAIAEFKVQQNNYSAQYGQGAGTITQIVSKSGTNDFYGSLFEFLRNSVFDARNFFATSVPPFQRNEFGATFGGPIRKNNSFFFVQYAGFRQKAG